MKSVVKFHGFLGKLSGLSGFELGFSRDPWWLYRIYVGSCGFYMGLKKSIGPTTDRTLKPLYDILRTTVFFMCFSCISHSCRFLLTF